VLLREVLLHAVSVTQVSSADVRPIVVWPRAHSSRQIADPTSRDAPRRKFDRCEINGHRCGVAVATDVIHAP
jgi:hypothetical protein